MIDPRHRLQSQHTSWIPAKPYQVADVIRDPGTWEDWVDKNTRFEMVEQRSPTDYTSYMRQKGVPFLRIKDRDVVLESRIARDPSGSLHFTGQAQEHPARPPLHQVVRMPVMDCHFDIAEEEGGSRVTYGVDLDMGGGIPMWLKRISTRDIASKTLRDLSQYMQSVEPSDSSELQDMLEPRGAQGARAGAALGARAERR